MSERLIEQETPGPIGKLVTDALTGYVDKAREDRKTVLAKRIDAINRKAFFADRDAPLLGLYEKRIDGKEKKNGTAWIPYVTATTALGQVAVSVRVIIEGENEPGSRYENLYVIMRVADQIGTTHDSVVAKSMRFNDGTYHVNRLPEFDSPEFGEVEAILTHIDGYIDTQATTSS